MDQDNGETLIGNEQPPGKTYGQQTLSCCASPSGELSLNREDREAVILVPLPCETNPGVNPS